jgi:hypothetical protein
MKYFISYTTRDGMVNKSVLKKIELQYIRKGKVYIDLLHNDSRFKQIRVFKELFTSDTLVVINTPSLLESPWVKIEILIARLRKMNILSVKLNYKSKNHSIINI